MSEMMEYYEATSTFRGNSGLRLRLGDLTIEHRSIEAELREAMETRLADAGSSKSKKRRKK